MFSKLFPNKNALIINLELRDPLNLFTPHIFFNKFLLYLVCMGILTACMSVYPHVCLEPRDQKRSSNTLELDRVTDGYKLSCGFWDLNPGSLEEEQVLLTTELALQPYLHPS